VLSRKHRVLSSQVLCQLPLRGGTQVWALSAEKVGRRALGGSLGAAGPRAVRSLIRPAALEVARAAAAAVAFAAKVEAVLAGSAAVACSAQRAADAVGAEREADVSYCRALHGG